MAERNPQFGDRLVEIRYIHSDDHPHKRGRFVRVVRRTGRLNPGTWWELTDGRGDFWLADPENYVLDGEKEGSPERVVTRVRSRYPLPPLPADFDGDGAESTEEERVHHAPDGTVTVGNLRITPGQRETLRRAARSTEEER